MVDTHGCRLRVVECCTWDRARRVSQIAENGQCHGCDSFIGDYDVIVKLAADDLGSIATTVVESIRQISGVLRSKTLAGAEF